MLRLRVRSPSAPLLASGVSADRTRIETSPVGSIGRKVRTGRGLKTPARPLFASSYPEVFQRVAVELDAQAGGGGDGEVALGVGAEGVGDQLVEVGRGRQVLDVAGDGQGGGQVQVGGEADRRVPAVRHQQDVVLV